MRISSRTTSTIATANPFNGRMGCGHAPLYFIRWLVVATLPFVVLQELHARPGDEADATLASDSTVAAIEQKLKGLGPKPGMNMEELLALLEIDPAKLDWATGSNGGVLYWARIEGGTREVSITKARKNADDVAPEGTLLSVDVSDVKYSQKLIHWTPEGGLHVPESAMPDPGARVLVDQPIPTKLKPGDAAWFNGPVGERAADWHDQRFSDWNRISDSARHTNRHRKSSEERGLIQGTYTIRIPKAYVPDGTWGCIVYFSSTAGPYLSSRLRDACDKYKLLYVGLKSSENLVGYHWGHAVFILQCVAELQQHFTFSAQRTVLADDENALPVLFAGLSHPELFGSVVLLRNQAVPTEVSRHYMEGNGPIPLDWIEPSDWARSRALGQRIGMTWSEPLYHTLFPGDKLKAVWSGTGARLHVIQSYSGDKAVRERERREPRRSVLAEFVEAFVATP